MAAMTNYRWAAELGHARGAFFAANLIYAQASPHNLRSLCDAAELYQQAAVGGIVEAMNCYGILLEEGRASESGLRDLHLAAAWYYQACVQPDRLEKGFENLAMLMISSPLCAFRSVQGDVITLASVKEFLLDFFESAECTSDDERRSAILNLLDAIDETGKNALPLVEEVSLTLSGAARQNRHHYGATTTASASASAPAAAASAPSTAATATSTAQQHGLQGPQGQQQRHGASSFAAAASTVSTLHRAAKSATAAVEVMRGAVVVTHDDASHDITEEVQVVRIPLAPRESSSSHSLATRAKRYHEEVQKLSRGPIQNQGVMYTGAMYQSTDKLLPVRDTLPPAHGAGAGNRNSHHPHNGQMYLTNGPVVPPSFVPRAVQYNAPVFKSDKPQPRTHLGGTGTGEGIVVSSYPPASASSSSTPAARPEVPQLSSPTRRQAQQHQLHDQGQGQGQGLNLSALSRTGAVPPPKPPKTAPVQIPVPQSQAPQPRTGSGGAGTGTQPPQLRTRGPPLTVATGAPGDHVQPAPKSSGKRLSVSHIISSVFVGLVFSVPLFFLSC
jgi:hypothetical protein